MGKFNLHGAGRKDCPVYSQRYNPAEDIATQMVFRPHSERQVSAVHELNRLRSRILELEEQLRELNE